jgi:dipeptidase D
VGCAGGINTNLSLPLEYEAIPAGYKQYKITAGGMKGGHSGIDIGKGKANALRILGRGLYQLKKQDIDLRLADVKGGSAHNAIPRDAYAVVFLPANNAEKAKSTIAEWSNIFNSEFKSTDPELVVAISENSEGNFDTAINAAKTQKVIELMLVIPHGVETMSPDIANLVETSNNFANLKVDNGAVKVLTSQRSSVVTKLHALTHRVESAARLAGGEAKSGDGYPPWQPNMDSLLLARSVKLYEKMYNKKPVVEVIHAGLECGIIGDRNPGMDMISIGPTLKYPHSPDEKIHVGSIGKVWDFIIELLKELK